MKKILYTLITVLLLISCHDDEMSNTSPSAVEKGKVTLNLSLYLPELEQVKSRSFSDSDGDGYLAYLQNCPLQLVVFDKNGVLVEAHDITPTSNNGTDEVNFSVNLETSTEQRHIHCIVNSPVKATEYEDFGLESDLIGELSKALDDENADDPTTDVNKTSHQDAYWQLLVLEKIDNTDYTKSKLQRIPLIRNFVKISVNTTITDASHFELLGYAVVNEWDKGTVAPYKGGGVFASLNDGENMKDYPTITNTEKYEGVWPSNAQLINRDATKVVFKEFTSATNGENTTYTGSSYYMYERRNTYADNKDIPPTYLLIKGKYRGGGESYYKLDLVYDKDDTGVNKQYYNLLRNFHYQINIVDVTGNGYATPKEAAEHAASNNLTGAIDIRDLTNISDGVDRLFVSYTDYTVVDKTNPVEIKYRFLEGNNTFNNTGVVTSIKEQTEYPIEDVYYQTDNGVVYIYEDGQKNGDYKSNVDIPQDSDGWSTIYVTFEEIPTDFKVYTNVLSFSYQGLIREVDYNLRSIMPMIVECNPMNVREGIKQQVAVNILIPTGITGENDPYQLFPLEFWVEADQLTISPNVKANKDAITLSPSEMPVESGISIIPNKNKQTFRYKRTITNEEYQTLVQTPVVRNGNEYVQIPCHFLTNTTNSATAVYAQNEYFTLVEEGSFENFSGSGMDRYGQKNTVTLNYESEESGSYRLIWKEGTKTTQSTSNMSVGSKTLSYTTDTWSDEISLTIITPSGKQIDYDFGERNKLFIKAKTSGTSLNDATTITVYSDSNYSQSLGTITDGELNSGVEIIYPGLQSDKSEQTEITNGITLYFEYSYTKNNIWGTTTIKCRGSMSLNDLLAGNQTLNFN